MPRVNDIFMLPIPNWGLRCPDCTQALAGLLEHTCNHCRSDLDMVRIVSSHRPIVDIGMRCGGCGYLLTGLTSERCPECGAGFSVRDFLERNLRVDVPVQFGELGYTDSHKKHREPVYTGHERPLPDFGLSCEHCRYPLAGATQDVCAHCGERFDVHGFRVTGGWVNLVPLLSHFPMHTRANAQGILYQDQVPFLKDNAMLNTTLGINLGLGRRGLRVPKEFVFDALAALARADEPSEITEDWQCPACACDVPAGFDVCWNCMESHPGWHGGPGDVSEEQV